MPARLTFRRRIGTLVLLAAIALITVTTVTLVLGRRSERQLNGIETRYVPLIELDRDLKRTAADLAKAVEDAAGAGEESKLVEADRLSEEFIERVHGGRDAIVSNGGDPPALVAAFRDYYAKSRALSAALLAGTAAGQLSDEIEAMRVTRRAFTSALQRASSPDRERIAAAFAVARQSHAQSLRIDILVACTALALMTLLSWRLIRQTVQSLRAVSAGVERIARGDFAYEIQVPPGDEIGDLAREANRTAARLREYRKASDDEAWIKNGLTELAEQIAGDLDTTAVGERAMTYLATRVGAASAVIHADSEQDRFALIAQRGVTEPATVLTSFQIGESVLGEAARDDKVRIGPADDLAWSGESSEAGRSALVVPLAHAGRVMGVLTLVLDGDVGDRIVELVSRARNMIGVALRVAESRHRKRVLLLEAERQAQAAQSANKELEAFSYSVSHDLRAPLRSIDGFSQALGEAEADRVSPKGQDYIRRIRAGAQRMGELIDDLLRLSRVGRAELRMQTVDLSALATAIGGELRKGAPDREVELVVEPAVTAVADARLLRIILENLLSNAWKFTSKVAHARIEIGVEESGDERVYFVRDNGAGFDMQHADRLFGAFQRLHTDKDFPGTGIGLATVQRIVMRHGGRIWGEAAVDRGATFRFTLPGATH